LNSLVDVQYFNPVLCNTAGTGPWTSGDPFTNVQSYFYWSSTTYFNIDEAWGVSMLNGAVFYTPKEPEENYNHVWPVRGGH